MEKFAKFLIPDNIYSWFVCSLQDRKYVTRFCGQLSQVRIINASIVQGSGIGPPSYVVGASDLHSVHPGNVLAKYADVLTYWSFKERYNGG